MLAVRELKYEGYHEFKTSLSYIHCFSGGRGGRAEGGIENGYREGEGEEQKRNSWLF